MLHTRHVLRLLALTLITLGLAAPTATAKKSGIGSWQWSRTNDNARWSPRAGLQVVHHRNRFYLMGGRTPIDPLILPIPGASEIWGDVWMSKNRGRSWRRIVDPETKGHWPARAFFKAVTKGRYMYVMGGQNFRVRPNPEPIGPPFISESDFFNDVWRSRDGVHWNQMTAEAPWAGRAGLSGVTFKGHIYIMGGSFNDDPAVIGGPPTRVYFNDVWRSRKGRAWERMTERAPWAPRAGARVVAKGGYMYLFGGEDGFTCESGSRCPPYYNDVWRSRDGAKWELVTAEAAWAARPGHEVVLVDGKFVLFGGFGLSTDPTDPFKPSNPMDVWVSRDGKRWSQVSDSPWNAKSPRDIKYDFDALVVKEKRSTRLSSHDGELGLDVEHRRGHMSRNVIYTFGGDRETFDFTDPTNYLNVDNDVWRFAPRWPHRRKLVDLAPARTNASPEALQRPALLRSSPNPFVTNTTIFFELEQPARATLRIYDVSGRAVRTLLNEHSRAGRHSATWDGKADTGEETPSGVYFYRLTIAEVTDVKRILKLR